MSGGKQQQPPHPLADMEEAGLGDDLFSSRSPREHPVRSVEEDSYAGSDDLYGPGSALAPNPADREE
ncbi:hypothetical protein [Kitasatospora camelliae]|uniref:Uncharacterized protein n=1 Tax=Kitasatospora camelliae TaxID=3156397 RepID=A0AAU8JPF9_9ACTN